MRYLVGIISVLVVVVLVGSVMVPIINDSTGGGVEYEDNPDWDGWVRFDLNTSAGATYNLQMSQDENGIYVENLTTDPRDVQIYDDSTTVEYSTIMYADSNMVVWSIDDTFNVQGKVNGSTVFINAPILDITRDSNGVEVVTDTDTYLFDAPTWAYVPLSQGKYGFYPYDADRGVEHPANAPTAVLGGGNVGVYAYNNSYTYGGLGLVMNPIVEDGLYYGATWEKQTDAGQFNPDDITIVPLDPSVIGGGDAGINPVIPIDDPFDPSVDTLSVPTPTYTDGDWGYDKITIDGVQKAVIVSYSGVGGGSITVPATIGGFDVYRFGKGGNGYNVFDTTLSATDLIISEGIVEINKHACNSCSGFTGSLVIPSTVTSIGDRAFYNCSGFTGSLVIPSAVTSIGSNCFWGCTGFTSLKLNEGLITLASSSFQSCSGITGSLVIPSTVTTISGSSFANCSGFTGSLVIPSAVTTIGNYAFNGMGDVTNVIISSDATPGTQAFSSMNSVTDILDLSDVTDYSVNRYGMPNTATVYDTIGDCFGFVSIVSIAHGTPGGMGEYSNLIYAIPIVVISALLVAFGAYVIRRDY